ncbi:MAG: DUF2437 domain-containing protein [Dehalococcoidia bacterium]|nr:DUF2437 domain-containing protein [Dehalococcoidia bacterium]
MKVARVRVSGKTSTVVVKGRSVHLVRGGPFGKLAPTGERFPLSKVQLLPPTQPSKILAIRVNYRSHAGDRPAPERPEPFLKAPNSLIGHGEPIVIPADAGRVDAEGEVVAVIGRRAKHVSEERVDDYVFGYTAGNDVSAREWQAGDGQWWRAKSADTFTSVGPWIETDLGPERIPVRTRVDGKEVQAADTSELIHSIRSCIARITKYVTLEPGDLIFTGTPGTTAEIRPGVTVEVEVDGVGVLSNPVIAEEPRG